MKPAVVPGAGLDWNATAHDYLAHRSGYPESFFRLLKAIGIGLEGQDILDLGTGTGALALPFARQGVRVVGVDASEQQLGAARSAAARKGLAVELQFALAEETGLPDASFDVVTASMCWAYFDAPRMVDEVLRLLRPGGVLLLAWLLWEREASDLTRATDAIVVKYNEGARTSTTPRYDPAPAWSVGRLRLRTYHSYIEPLAFTRESWRGRIRASKWIGAALPAARVDAFDRELDDALRSFGTERVEVPHRITLQIFEAR
jgi:SAM-dependent methyltransferase